MNEKRIAHLEAENALLIDKPANLIIAELRAENDKLRELIAQCATDFEAAANGSGVNFYQCAVDCAEALLGEAGV